MAYIKVQSANYNGKVDVDFSHLIKFLGPLYFAGKLTNEVADE